MPESRKWYQFWKREPEVFEENTVVMVPEDETHEFNTDIGTAYIRMLQSSGEMVASAMAGSDFSASEEISSLFLLPSSD